MRDTEQEAELQRRTWGGRGRLGTQGETEMMGWAAGTGGKGAGARGCPQGASRAAQRMLSLADIPPAPSRVVPRT